MRLTPKLVCWMRAIATAVEVSIATVERVRRHFVVAGLAAALERKAPDPTYVRRLDGAAEARLIAVACGVPPTGSARWTLRLLAARLVELEVVASVCYETVRQTLRANGLKPWLKRQWGLAPTASADFVCRMADVLEVYHRPLAPQRPASWRRSIASFSSPARAVTILPPKPVRRLPSITDWSPPTSNRAPLMCWRATSRPMMDT